MKKYFSDVAYRFSIALIVSAIMSYPLLLLWNYTWVEIGFPKANLQQVFSVMFMFEFMIFTRLKRE